MPKTKKEGMDILKLLQNKELMQSLPSVLNLLLAGPMNLWEKHLQLKNEQHKEQLSLEREKVNINAKNIENERISDGKALSKWLWYSGILFFLSVLTVSVLGYFKIISEGVTGTILAGIIGYVFGKRTSKQEKSDKQRS